MRYRRSRGVQRGQHVKRIHALPGFHIAVGDRLECKAAGDIDQRVQLAKMRRGGIDRLFGLRRVREVDAADLDPVRGHCCLRWRIIDARHPGATRERLFCDYLPKRAQGAGHHNYFSVHDLASGAERATFTLPRQNSFAMP